MECLKQIFLFKTVFQICVERLVPGDIGSFTTHFIILGSERMHIIVYF